jgi:hypothetical protein
MSESERRWAERHGLLFPEPERPEVLPKPSAHYRGKHSRYPEQVRVSFRDGNTFVYEMRAEQPAPVIAEGVEVIDIRIGYPVRRRRWRK